MDDSRRKIVEFNKLNAIGKAVYVGGMAVRFASQIIDTAIDRVADVIAEAEKAFKQGSDPNIEDAKILEERENQD